MLNIDSLEMLCPSCSGQGQMENPTWAHFWTLHGNLKDWFRNLEQAEQITIAEKMLEDQPSEPMFYICKQCKGKGKVLTNDGIQLVNFLRSWLNDNY